MQLFRSLIRPIVWMFKTKDYRPLVLRLGDLIKVNPVLLFVILFSLSFVVSDIFKISLTNCLGISYVIPYLIWFSRKTKTYLKGLESSLNLDKKGFQKLLNQTGRYHFYRFALISILAPLLVFIVNYNTVGENLKIEGQLYFLGLSLSRWFAIVTGMLLLQMNYITITEAIRFNKIEKKYAQVDLLDLQKLDSFSHIGIAAAMSLIGIYTVIPFSVWNEPEMMNSLISSFVISLPILLINLTIPLYGVYAEIRKKLKSEKKLLQKAINDDKSSLTQLAIFKKQQNLSTLDLINYRKYINELSPVPIAQNSIIKFLSSLILLVLSWIVPYYYESFLALFN